jgi:YidC/Oxa1 family membrane protein insertase
VNPLTYLDELVARAIMGLHALLSHVFPADSGWAWGLSIVILVMIIRLLLVPLFVKQIHAQRKMAQHQPQLQELRKKYKNDKQKLQEEQMKFFKENGVNPLAGCLPMIPQMIIFICLFSVLRKVTDWTPGTPLAYGLTESAVESARKATIFGVHLGDKLLFPHTPTLGVSGSLIILVSVIISASTTFLTVRQTSKRGLMQPGVDPDNPMAASQKYMMYIVPFFSLTGLYWQYGLVLYWVTTNVWTLGQQFIMFRNWVPPVPAEAAPVAASVTGSATRSATRSTAARSTAARSSSSSSSSTARSTTARSTAARSTGARSATTPSANATRQGSSATRSTGTRPASSTTRPATGTKSGATAKQSGTISSGGAASGSSVADGTAKAGSATQVASNGTQNGSEKRGLLRLGRSKPEPEPVEDVPVSKVVRQQPTRQSRSKRSGNR